VAVIGTSSAHHAVPTAEHFDVIASTYQIEKGILM